TSKDMRAWRCGTAGDVLGGSTSMPSSSGSSGVCTRASGIRCSGWPRPRCASPTSPCTRAGRTRTTPRTVLRATTASWRASSVRSSPDHTSTVTRRVYPKAGGPPRSGRRLWDADGAFLPEKGGSVSMQESRATTELAEFRDEMDTSLGVLRGVQLEHDLVLRETQRTVTRVEKVQQVHGRRLERLEGKLDHLEGRFDR